jgi:methylmalonyl-CoA/ethylmalonyl-CoA epimerase
MRLLQVALHATDLPRATAFYTDLLGAPPLATYDPPGLVFFALGDTRLLLDTGGTSGQVYLEVDDLDATLARLRSQGVPVTTEPHRIFTHDDETLGPAGTEEWHAFVTDSEGNTVGLVELRPVP